MHERPRTRLTGALCGALAATLALAGCATSPQGAGGAPPLQGTCNAGPTQDLVGQQATAELGQRLLALSGADALRWAPPDTPMTREFRADRLTVWYDRNMRIERISCG
jgi:hypothetical protein